ncbi:MAG: gamma carbonic anhydrase family protein [Methanocalculaceae archaeon]|jgi:carbonic anhydrase/acetyltransferase-like protein (isoleucine patch superfamily)|nr:gamma carbonic anhydrase family protein [Methanocalculaceae archaeon]
MESSNGLPTLACGGRWGERTFVAPNATIVGDITLGDDVTVLFGAVLRADMAPIIIGSRSNVQDNAVIHESTGHQVTIGSNVSIGHGAIIHGCTIGDDCLIGMGAIVLNGAVIGKGSLVAAGTLVSERKIIPPNSLVIGVPGKVVRELTPEETTGNLQNADTYVGIGKRYQHELA